MSNAARIFVRFTQVGLHHWPDAPPGRNYLSFPHRHVFHVEAAVHVTHDDRAIEFHDFLDSARAMFGSNEVMQNYGPQSCEMLARKLSKALARRYSCAVTVTVTEDNECGAVVESTPFDAEQAA
jgi:hypothetical protein